MKLTNLHTDIRTTLPTFKQQLEEKFGGILIIPIALLILIVVLPITMLVLVFYIFPKQLFDRYILGRTPIMDEVEDEPDIEIWSKLYQSSSLEIESLEINPEDEFDDIRWHGGLLMKLRTSPSIHSLEELYFLTESCFFANSLILFQVDRDIEVKKTKIIQLDLETFDMRLIKELDGFYLPKFNLNDEYCLNILCEQGHKKIEITLRSK